MRFVIAVAAVATLLMAGVAAAGPAECQRYNRQIEHYQGMVERADELDNDVWAERTQRHVDLLMDYRRKAGCPEPLKDSGMGKAFAQLVKLAASAAVTYFTFGAF